MPSYSNLEARILAFIERGEGEFGAMLLEVFRFQRKQNPAYGNFCHDLPEPQRWQEIPAVPQSAFKHFKLRSFPDAETARTFRTSGTTGEGYGQHHFRNLTLYEAAALGGWAHAELPPKVDVALMASSSDAPVSSLSRMAEWLRPDFFAIENGKLDCEKVYAFLNEGTKPLALFGTALAFLNYFEWLGERTQPLPPRSVAVETGGYKGSGRDIAKPELYALFEKYFGLPYERVANEYGMTELSSQFYSRGIGTCHHCPPWVKAVVINPVTGKEVADGNRGVLKIYDLANLGSVCAVLTEDLAIRRDEDFELLGRDPAALPRGCSRAADDILRGN